MQTKPKSRGVTKPKSRQPSPGVAQRLAALETDGGRFLYVASGCPPPVPQTPERSLLVQWETLKRLEAEAATYPDLVEEKHR